jgi:hypothetical protein
MSASKITKAGSESHEACRYTTMRTSTLMPVPMMYTPQAQTIVDTVTSPVVSAGVTVAGASEDVVIDQDGPQGGDQVGTLGAVGECIPYCADVVQRVGSLSEPRECLL